MDDQNHTFSVPVIGTNSLSGLQTAAQSFARNLGPMNEPRMFGNCCAQLCSASFGAAALCCPTYVPPRYSAIIVKRAMRDAKILFDMILARNHEHHWEQNSDLWCQTILRPEQRLTRFQEDCHLCLSHILPVPCSSKRR